MLVQEIMTEDVETASPELPLSDAVRLLFEGDFRHLPVTNATGELLGILSERDVRDQLLPILMRIELPEDSDLDPMKQSVSEVMNADVHSLHPEDEVSDAIDTMLTHRVGALPVVDAATSELVGIVSYIDILRAAQEHF